MNTRGTTVDHIGFEIKNLEEFLQEARSQGHEARNRLSVPLPAIGLNISYMYDPTGVYIEMTEGYTRVLNTQGRRRNAVALQ